MSLQRFPDQAASRHHSGFTLVELLIVVALIGVVAAVAVPNFRQMVESNRVSAGTNSIVSALNYARSEALRHGRLVVVDARVAGDWTQGLEVTRGTEQLRVTEPLDGGVTITGELTEFRGNGLARAATTFVVCGDNTLPGREINVTLGGRVQTGEVACP